MILMEHETNLINAKSTVYTETIHSIVSIKRHRHDIRAIHEIHRGIFVQRTMERHQHEIHKDGMLQHIHERHR